MINQPFELDPCEMAEDIDLAKCNIWQFSAAQKPRDLDLHSERVKIISAFAVHIGYQHARPCDRSFKLYRNIAI